MGGGRLLDYAVVRRSCGGCATKSYTGKAIKQVPIVRVGGKLLKAGVDYTLSYKDNKKHGIASIVVKGKGAHFKSTKTLKFEIA